MTISKKLLIAILFSTFALLLCSYAGHANEGTRSNNSLGEIDNDPYRLNTGDHLRIYVFGVAELTGDFRVDAKGRITMPLIGDVMAEGLDKNELQATITRKLMEGSYFNDPKVTVEIIALQPFYILGEVRTPGSYEYQPDMTLFKAIAIAGGYTPRASKGHATIIRIIHNEKVEIRGDEDTPILPGDSIKIKQRFF